jgi:hypothetical protein
VLLGAGLHHLLRRETPGVARPHQGEDAKQPDDDLLLAVRFLLRKEQAPDPGPHPCAARSAEGGEELLPAAVLPGTRLLPGPGMLVVLTVLGGTQ